MPTTLTLLTLTLASAVAFTGSACASTTSRHDTTPSINGADPPTALTPITAFYDQPPDNNAAPDNNTMLDDGAGRGSDHKPSTISGQQTSDVWTGGESEQGVVDVAQHVAAIIVDPDHNSPEYLVPYFTEALARQYLATRTASTSPAPEPGPVVVLVDTQTTGHAPGTVEVTTVFERIYLDDDGTTGAEFDHIILDLTVTQGSDGQWRVAWVGIDYP